MKIHDNDIFGCVKRIIHAEDNYCKFCVLRHTMKRAHADTFTLNYLDAWSTDQHLCNRAGQIVKKIGPHTWVNHSGDEFYAS